MCVREGVCEWRVCECERAPSEPVRRSRCKNVRARRMRVNSGGRGVGERARVCSLPVRVCMRGTRARGVAPGAGPRLLTPTAQWAVAAAGSLCRLAWSQRGREGRRGPSWYKRAGAQTRGRGSEGVTRRPVFHVSSVALTHPLDRLSIYPASIDGVLTV